MAHAGAPMRIGPVTCQNDKPHGARLYGPLARCDCWKAFIEQNPMSLIPAGALGVGYPLSALGGLWAGGHAAVKLAPTLAG